MSADDGEGCCNAVTIYARHWLDRGGGIGNGSGEAGMVDSRLLIGSQEGDGGSEYTDSGLAGDSGEGSGLTQRRSTRVLTVPGTRSSGGLNGEDIGIISAGIDGRARSQGVGGRGLDDGSESTKVAARKLGLLVLLLVLLLRKDLPRDARVKVRKRVRARFVALLCSKSGIDDSASASSMYINSPNTLGQDSPRPCEELTRKGSGSKNIELSSSTGDTTSLTTDCLLPR